MNKVIAILIVIPLIVLTGCSGGDCCSKTDQIDSTVKTGVETAVPGSESIVDEETVEDEAIQTVIEGVKDEGREEIEELDKEIIELESEIEDLEKAVSEEEKKSS